jgi:Tol biopolymer transport system component
VTVTACVLALVIRVESSQAAFPGQNGKIVFVSDRDGNNEVYTMNADGSNQSRLTNNTAGEAWPSWSPDGTKIAFTSSRDGNVEIYTMNADGSNQTNISNNKGSDQYPAWPRS